MRLVIVAKLSTQQAITIKALVDLFARVNEILAANVAPEIKTLAWKFAQKKAQH